MNCNKCKILLNINNWLPSQQKKNKHICKFCLRQDNNKRYHLNKNKYLSNIKNKYINLKKDIFNHYGGQCQICHEKDYDKLSIDHIYGKGRNHRLSLQIYSGTQFYKWVHKHKPNYLRLLCFNCNCQHSIDKYLLIIMNKNYLNNKLCKYCFSSSKIKKGICSLCSSKLKHNYQINLKLKAYRMYGNSCALCRCNQPQYLTIDHINNNGNHHRKSIYNIYSWLKNHNYPRDNYQVLCFNCNYLKSFNKINVIS